MQIKILSKNCSLIYEKPQIVGQSGVFFVEMHMQVHCLHRGIAESASVWNVQRDLNISLYHISNVFMNF